MSTGEGENPRDGKSASEDDKKGRGERIGVGGGDDSVSRIQLAARWAEAYAADADSLPGMLRRFRTAYEYLDAVIHGVEPPELDNAREQSAAPASSAASQRSEWARPEPAPPPWASPRPPEPGPPPPPPAPPQPEPRPWG